MGFHAGEHNGERVVPNDERRGEQVVPNAELSGERVVPTAEQSRERVVPTAEQCGERVVPTAEQEQMVPTVVVSGVGSRWYFLMSSVGAVGTYC